MKINQLDSTPRNIRYEDEFESHMTSEIADDVIEIFQTPLTGTYNWDYTLQDNRIKNFMSLARSSIGILRLILIGLDHSSL